MNANHWLEKLKHEIKQAEAARQMQNEGKARVCARRAVGHIIAAYLSREGFHPQIDSAYSRIQYFVNHPNISPKIREVAGHFLLRITHQHSLPVDADLIAETRWLAKKLLDVEL